MRERSEVEVVADDEREEWMWTIRRGLYFVFVCTKNLEFHSGVVVLLMIM